MPQFVPGPVASVSDQFSIPRPRAISSYRSLGRIPDLTDDERIVLAESLPAEIPQYISMNVCWSEQEHNAKAEFLCSMTRKFPWLSRYEGAWPVEAFAAEWLGRHRTHYNRRRNPRRAARPRVEVVVERRPRGRPPSSASTARTAVDPPPAAPAPQASQGISMGSVRRFLASLQPPLDSIAPILIQGGIRDRASLESLIAMTEAQQRAIFERLPLTVFQVQLILNELEKRRE